MSQIIFKSMLLKPLTLVLLCAGSLSFAAFAGGDSYEIYLNNKLIQKQYVHDPSFALMNLQLDKANVNDNLVVRYSHCGVTGKGRSIVIKDGQDNILKEWKFADATGSDVSMSIPVKEILDLQKNNSNTSFSLYYFSSQMLPKGRMLASIQTKGKGLVQNQSPKEKKSSLMAAGFFGI